MLAARPSRARPSSVVIGRVLGGTMQGLETLLSDLKRVLTPGAAEAPLAWLLVAILLVLVLGILLLLFRRRAPDPYDVDRLFLASAATTRKAREISEIDSFARKAAASAEELKARVRKLRTGHFQQVKIYIDHSNFIRTWTQVVHNRDRPLQHDINWATLPQVLMEETNEWLSNARNNPRALVYRGTNVYGTLFEEDYFKLLESMLRLEQTAPNRLPLPMRLRKETV